MKPSKQWKKSSRWRATWKRSDWRHRAWLWNLVLGESLSSMSGRLHCIMLRESVRMWSTLKPLYLEIDPWNKIRLSDVFPKQMGLVTSEFTCKS